MLVAIAEKDKVTVKNEKGGTIRQIMKRGVVSANINSDETMLVLAVENLGVEILKIPGFGVLRTIPLKDATDARWSDDNTLAISRKTGVTELRNAKNGSMIRTLH